MDLTRRHWGFCHTPMKPVLRQALLVGLIAFSLVGSALADPAPPQTRDYPPIQLRGYGTLSGTFSPGTIGGQPVSTLKIVCDDVAKAKLVQAKYISDLQVLPGIRPMKVPAQQANLPGFYADSQGVLLVARDGTNVTILTGPTPEIVARLAESTFGAVHGSLIYAPEIAVPMYLDRWDKFGFRFYYGPFVVPTGTKQVTDYDPTQDFDFAEKSNHAGLQFWHTPHAVDNAEGITNLNWFDWALKAAQEHHLPVGINDGLEHQTWAYNRYPEQVIQYQPGFLGGWYGSMNFSEEIMSWNGLEAKDVEYAQLQQSLRELTKYDNITSWLEPHEEMSHGVADLLIEYGPVADQGYRAFLTGKYGDVATVSKRWYGDDRLKSWDDVHAPELASFLGWGLDDIDLAGPWRVKYDMSFGPEAGSTKLNDSSWPLVPAPNNAIVRFLPKKPAVFRRHFTLDPTWQKSHDKIWLYVWDLNDVRESKSKSMSNVNVYVNGKLIPEEPRKITADHWVALDVSKALTTSENLIAITLPRGLFNYRVYLSPHEPVLYPNLSPEENARWVDYYDWNVWFRGNAVYRGSQMIRQVDPDRGIMLMSPYSYVESISRTAKGFGGDFHDTGAMAGFWTDYASALAQGMALPVSAEPGSPAHSVPELKAFFGRWLTEGTNGIDYFQHEGDIEWFPDIQKTFEDNLPIYTSIGKYHPPAADVAALYSTRNQGLLDFPWSSGQGYGDSNPLHLGSGYGKWNVRAVLRGLYDVDGLMESSFSRGDASRYKVIIDTNTSIMDDALIANIEQYVRDGGVFITFVQSGRHTSTEKEAWPIEKLTGYHVTRLTQATPWQPDAIQWAKDQPFGGDCVKQPADGLSLQNIGPDTQDLAYWKDGSVAIGMRHFGDGAVIEIGCRFTKWGLPDRIDADIWDYLNKTYGRTTEYGLPAKADGDLMTPALKATGDLFTQFLRWRDIKPIPARIEPRNDDALLRHYLSNNGIYDVWVVWNQSPTRAVSSNITLDGLQPPWMINLNDGTRLALAAPSLPVRLGPLESVIYLTPHGDVATAPQKWFDLQRNWWQGTDDSGTPLPKPENKLAVNLTPDWAFRPLGETQSDITDLLDPNLDDSRWTHMRLGIFTIPDYPATRHALFRKTFTVPENWNHGKTSLWLRAWDGLTFLGTGRVYLDGAMIQDASTDGVVDNEVGGKLKAGSTHQLAVEIAGTSPLLGSRGPAWIAYHPDPAARQDLSGNWDMSADGMHYNPPAPLPGPALMANRRLVTIDASQSARTVVLHVMADNGFIKGVIINGRFVPRFHHNIGPEINLNITPWVKFGQDNEFLIMGGDKGKITELSLEFHDRGTYP
jgi:hypothetical protein